MPNQIITEEVDIRGQICPSTLLTVLREVNARKSELKGGKICLTILSDNRSSVTNIAELVGNMGYQVKTQKEDNYYRIDIREIS